MNHKAYFRSALILGIVITLSLVIYTKIGTQGTTKIEIPKKTKAKSQSEKAEFNQQRLLHEFNRQANTATGLIPKEEKISETKTARNLLKSPSLFSRNIEFNYRNRGPSNYGGRARALVIDRTDATGNTILAAGVSGGIFRTTDGGTNWTKVSPNNAIHNATTIAQDPRIGFENIWYYGTGEFIGNSASLSGSFFAGQGIWKSENGGLSWTQMPSTNSEFEIFDSEFDFIFRLAVHPLTGDLYAGTLRSILRFDGNDWSSEISNTNVGINGNLSSDIVIADDGRVYAALGGGNATNVEGIWTSETGIGNWSRINEGSFNPAGRIVLALAPSNQDKLYCLYFNGNNLDANYFNQGCLTPQQEVDLWLWNQNTEVFTSYNDKLPFEGGCTLFNDPFTTFQGYTMSIGVKPDDEDFVIIGGSNAYKIDDITDLNSEFERIGGYLNASSYFLYNLNGDDHHPDMHAFVFSPNDPKVMYSTSDGGIHRTDDLTASTVGWVNLNNNFQTYQYFHVAIDPQEGSDLVIGGTQDNGTSVGGSDFNIQGFPELNDLTTHTTLLGGDGVAVAISRDGCNDKPTYFMGFQNGTIYRLCEQYELITPIGSSSQFVTYFYLDPDNNNTLYYAGENTLYRTTDSRNVTSANWDNLGNTSLLGDADWFQHMSASRGTYNASSSYLLLGGDEGRIYRLDDPRNTNSLVNAIDITPPGAAIGFPSIVTGLAVHPTNNNVVMATYSNYGNQNIFITTNAMADAPTWSLIERNLSSHSIRSAAIVEIDNEITYLVGTARGLYSSSDPTMNDWQLEAPNELGLALVSDLSYRPSDGHLLIGTHGNGMYEGIPSKVLSSTKQDHLSTLKIYPNPVNQEINLTGTLLLNQNNTYSIYNLNGQLVSEGQFNSKQIRVNDLSEGLYFLKIKTNTNEQTLKFYKK